MTQLDIDELKEELLQCRRCGLCRNAVYEARGFDGVCPVWKNTSGFETSFMRGKIQVALALIDGVLDKTPENMQSIFECTLCGNCTNICASEFEPAHALEKVREYLNEVPNEVRDTITKKIMDYGNPYEEDRELKAKWIESLDFEVPEKGETLYYVGCTAAMRIPEVAEYTTRILKASGDEFAIMRNEPCCGSVMMRTGRMDAAKKNAENVAEMLEATGVKRIVVSCAGCLKTLRKDYPEKFGIEMPEILHIVEYAEELLKEGRIKPKRIESKVRVTYHDPCHMGRELGIYESPREVLRNIPGIEVVEMETNRDTAMCCGAGGGLRSQEANLSKKIAASRVQDAVDVGAQQIATACPFCEHNLNAGTKILDSDVSVVDIVELLARSLE